MQLILLKCFQDTTWMSQYRTYIAAISMYVKLLMNKRNRLLSLDKRQSLENTSYHLLLTFDLQRSSSTGDFGFKAVSEIPI